MALSWKRLSLAGALVVALAAAPAAYADGTETLGTPSVPITTGTDVTVAGVGMQPFADSANTFGVNLPSDAIVKQVLVYWEGHYSSGSGPDHPDTQINVNGTPVNGQLIGGPSNFFLNELWYTYRADITNLNVVKSGNNSIEISGMNFLSTFVSPTGNDGAGVVVVYD